MVSDFIDKVNQIYAPEKFGISHKLVTLLLTVSKNHSQEIPRVTSAELIEELQRFTSAEESFLIAKTEYELKEKRFFDKLYFSAEKLEQEYREIGLSFTDINQDELLNAINSFSLIELSNVLANNRRIIELDSDHCYSRVNLLKRIWRRESDLLVEELTNFEHRGLRIASNNLRLKLLPEVKELKSVVKDNFTQKSNSRKEVRDRLTEFLEQVKDDIFGDLTDAQISLYTSLTEEMSITSLFQMLNDAQSRSDLLELIKSKKIKLKFEKLFDKLI